MTYQVAAPMVYLKVAGLAGMLGHSRGGYVVTPLYRGALVPSDIHPESLQRHLDNGMIIDLDQPASERQDS